MSILDKLNIEEDVVDDGDRIGGEFLIDSAVYPTTIELAYYSTSRDGAIGLNLVFKTEGGFQLKQTFWIQGKNGQTYWEDKKGDRHDIPGMNNANALCLLTLGKTIKALQDPEVKVINLWNFDTKSEVPTKVEMAMELLDQEVTLGVIRQTVDKNIQGDDGKWVPSGETRDENEIDKIFNSETKLTVTEIKAGVTEPQFHDIWRDKWTGVTKNKAKGKAGTGAVSGAPGKGSQPATKSLFT